MATPEDLIKKDNLPDPSQAFAAGPPAFTPGMPAGGAAPPPQSFPAGSPPNPSAPTAGAVNMPGVTPITEQSFGPGANTSVQPQAAPEAPKQPDVGWTPLGPVAGLQADAQTFNNVADYYRKSGEAAAQGKLDEAAIHDKFAQDQMMSLGQSKNDWILAQSKQAEREKAMDDAIAKGRAMSIDPDRYWHNKGTASNILAAISVGLGAFGSGMTHGATGNPALTLINNAIEHDINSQKADIENYWNSVKQQGQLDDTAFNRALVTQNMQSNLRLAGYKVYETDLRAIQSKTESQLVKLGVDKQIADLQLPMNAERKNIAAQMAALQLQQQQARAAGLAAQTARLDKLAKERRDAFGSQVNTLITQGYDPEDAAKKVNQQLDQQFPELAAHPNYSSPGQKYQVAKYNITQNYDILRQSLNNKDPRLADKAYQTTIAMLQKNGMSEDEARMQVEFIKNASHDDIKKAVDGTLTSSGVVDPYASATPTTSSMAGSPIDALPKKDKERAFVDPTTGQAALFPNKESADKYRTDAVDNHKVQTLIRDYMAIVDKHSGITGGFSTIANRTDANNAKFLRGQIAMAMMGANGTHKFNQEEYDNYLKQIPDITEWRAIGSHKDDLMRLDEAYKALDDSSFKALGGQPIKESRIAPSAPGRIIAPQGSATSTDPFTPAGPPMVKPVTASTATGTTTPAPTGQGGATPAPTGQGGVMAPAAPPNKNGQGGQGGAKAY